MEFGFLILNVIIFEYRWLGKLTCWLSTWFFQGYGVAII